MPLTAAEQTLANMSTVMGKPAPKRNPEMEAEDRGRGCGRAFSGYGVNTPYPTIPKLVKRTRTTDPGSEGGESRGPYSERLDIKPLFFWGR